MLSQRSQRGGTLALIVASMIVIIIIGIGFFFLTQMMGGGREAQQATDAGNLNVAKKSMVSPAISPDSTERLNFGGLFTSEADPKVNLQIYNRFVGKAFLVALNAAADGNGDAIAHAQQELALVEGPNGLGQRLWQALKTPENTQGFFGSIAAGNSIRMLSWNKDDKVQSDNDKNKVSFMRQNAKAPSNVRVEQAQVPVTAATNAVMNNDNYIATRGTKKFIIGYTPINLAGLSIYAVPVRPGEQPHLVSQTHFAKETNSPLRQGNNSLLPPNAFESNSNSKELHGGLVNLRSSAIVGATTTEFTAAIPHGFVVIDNQVVPGLANSVPAFAKDIFADALMSGVMLALDDGFMSKDLAAFDTIKNATKDGAGNIALGLGDPLEPKPNQTQLNELHDHLKNGQQVVMCNSITAFEEPCKSKLKAIQDTYKPTGNTGGFNENNLMAVEWLKAEVLRVRAGLPMDGPGCGFARADGQCTGLKQYSHGSTYSTVPFGSNGSLITLMNQAGGAEFKTAIQQRMHQINPAATDYESVFNTLVPMNSIMYLYNDPNSKQFVLANSLPFDAPDLSNSALKLPDGTPQERFTTLNDLNGEIINVPGEQGYPNPWDCPPGNSAPGFDGHGVSIDNVTWTPSSGYLNLLGVVRLRNCARGGGNWCCPC